MANTQLSIVPPPEQQPAFILDVPNWTVRKFKDCEQAIKDAGGYGAISYAWGKFETRKEWGTSKDRRYPQFNIGMKSDAPAEKLEWVFPVVRKLNDKGVAATDQPEIFKVDDVKKALEALKVKFAWWDWACIPQGWDKAFDSTPTPGAKLHKDLEGINWVEMGKMRYVYPRSCKGTLWFHQTIWTGPNDSVKGPVQKALDICAKMRSTPAGQRTIEGVRAAVDAIEAARANEASLVSLWSFQEGVLLSSFERPQQITKSSEPLDTSVLLDHNGDRLPIETSLRGQADLLDLVEMTSALTLTIADIFRIKAEDPSYAATQGITKVIEPWTRDSFEATLAKWFGTPSLFTTWCYDPKNEGEAKKLLIRLIASGLANYAYNSPLSLREALFGRVPNFYTPALDCDVMTLLGAVDVDMIAEIKAAEALPQADKDKAIRRDFIRKLFQNYQWRMLFCALERRTWSPNMSSFWPTLVNTEKYKKRPQFAALDTYVGSAYLESLYGPRKPSPPKFPKDQPALPELEVAHSETQEVLVKATSGYKIYNLKTPPPPTKPEPVWTGCMFYGFAPTSLTNTSPDGFPMPNLVQFTKVAAQDLRAVFGDKVLLLPIENLPQTGLPGGMAPRVRCVIVRDWLDCGKAGPPVPGMSAASLGDPEEVAHIARTGVFAGVADIEGLNEKYKTDELDGDLALF